MKSEFLFEKGLELTFLFPSFLYIYKIYTLLNIRFSLFKDRTRMDVSSDLIDRSVLIGDPNMTRPGDGDMTRPIGDVDLTRPFYGDVTRPVNLGKIRRYYKHGLNSKVSRTKTLSQFFFHSTLSSLHFICMFSIRSYREKEKKKHFL